MRLPLRPILTDRNAFLILKATNLVVITANSFLLVYVLVRVLSLDVYPAAVLISSVGVYIMATDLGYSGFVYARTRQSFLNTAAPHGSEAEVFTLYLAVALAAALAGGVAIVFFPAIPPGLRLAMGLYFMSIVLALPWGLLRKVAAAVDLYLQFELLELMRRGFFLAIAGAMLAGLSFLGFTILCLLAWGVAFAAAARMLRRRRMPLIATASASVGHLRSNYRNIGRSGALTVTEFVIYTFPYLAIPFLFDDKVLLVAFDIFYKVVRFGSVSYGVPADSFLPAQTRAFYAGDRVGVVRTYRRVVLLGLAPLGVSLVVLVAFGDRIFTTLLSHGGIVGLPLRASMAVMLIALLFQNAAGTFLLGTGHYGRLSRLALITLGLMAGLVGITWTLGLSFFLFMYLYVGLYCVHAIIYTVVLGRLLGFIGPQTADVPLQPQRAVP